MSDDAKEMAEKRQSFTQDVDFVVYRQRFFVLAALSINYFMWNWASARTSIIAPSYAKFYNTTNQFDLFGSGEVGVDSLSLIPAIMLVFFYVPCAYVIDRKGIRFMKLGSLVLAIQSWLWYLNDAGAFGPPSIIPILVIKVVCNAFIPLVSTSLLAVSNRWFPVAERAKATATVALISTMGSVAVTIVGPLFETSDDLIILDLKSCTPSAETLAKVAAFQANNTLAVCDTSDNEASEFADFCCASDANVELYAIILAVLCTLSTVFTFVVVKDAPPTPPSGANENVQLLPNFFVAMKHMAKYRNYLTLCLADFVVSGPVLVLSIAVARMLPPVIKDFDFIIAAVGIALAIPGAVAFAVVLDRRHNYWEMTTGGYTVGAICWIISTIAFAAGGAGAYIMVPLLIGAISAFTAWQAAVYETKLEYVFSNEFQIEGLVVGIDRMLINLATAVFVSTLAPETVGGPVNTYIIGCALFVVGAALPYTISKKRDYLRYNADKESKSITAGNDL